MILVALMAVGALALIGLVIEFDLAGWSFAPIAIAAIGGIQRVDDASKPALAIADATGRENGIVVIAVPPRMQLGSGSTVGVVITKAAVGDKLAHIRPALETKTIEVGAAMNVSVSGDEIAVTNPHTKPQRLEWPRGAAWHFTVVPTALGQQSLRVRVAIDHGSSDTEILNLSRSIVVEGSLPEKVAHWLKNQHPIVQAAVWLAGIVSAVSGVVEFGLGAIRFMGI